ncbi:MAG: hypothetical protein H6658_19570 [Ardenticatenaceae bacterium]|nr:hypothetical protein [Ardenticatenaceae bacterium]
MSDIIELSRPETAVSHFLKRYPTERRRSRMKPHYEAMLAEVTQLAAPRAIAQEFSLDKLPGIQHLFTNETVSVVLALCTLGASLDKRQTELIQEDLMLAVILDEITLAWVVAGTREIHGQVRQKMGQQGLKAGPAYRPGVGRWPLTAQYTIFDLLPTHLIEVSLNDAAVMFPRMSTSLIIPIMDRHPL